MKTINKFVDIKASPELIWGAIINPSKYQLWTSVFQEGSYFDGGWQKGDSIKFLLDDVNGHTKGLYSEIVVSQHLEHLSIKHLGLVTDGIIDYTSQEVKKWAPSYEDYYLERLKEDCIRFSVEVEVDDEEYASMCNTWNQALEKLKELCEKELGGFKPVRVEVVIEAPLVQVWENWVLPEHVKEWNFASDEWHCPKASNDLTVGGRFVYTMAAKDGSMSFDFAGTYTDLVEGEYIASQLDDGRLMKVSFKKVNETQTKVMEDFDAEDANSLDLQKNGWQAILYNFKNLVESKFQC